MSQASASEVAVTKSPPKGPGARLKALREARHQEAERVAQDLNLALVVVEALEADCYEDLHGPVFIKGYIRSYARLMEEPAEPLIKAYLTQAGQEPTPKVASVRPMVSRVPRAMEFPWLVVLLVLLLLAGAGWWFWAGMPGLGQFKGLIPGQEGAAAKQTAESQSGARPGVDAGVISLDSVAPLVLSEPGSVGEVEAEAPAVDEGKSVGGEVPVRTPAAETPAEPVGSSEVGSSEPEGQPLTPPVEVASEASATPAPASPPAPGLAQVVLTALKDSWVDVRDGEGNRRLSRIIPAGETRTVEGPGPLSVIVGNTSGVEVKVNGQPFDHRAFSRGNVARFKVQAP